MDVHVRWPHVDTPNRKVKIREEFLAVVALPNGEAQTIYDSLIKCITRFGLHLSFCISVGTDGASTMTGRHNGTVCYDYVSSAYFSEICLHFFVLFLFRCFSQTEGETSIHNSNSLLQSSFSFVCRRCCQGSGIFVPHIWALVNLSLGLFPFFSNAMATLAGILFASQGSFTRSRRIGAFDGSPKGWPYPLDVNDQGDYSSYFQFGSIVVVLLVWGAPARC